MTPIRSDLAGRIWHAAHHNTVEIAAAVIVLALPVAVVILNLLP